MISIIIPIYNAEKYLERTFLCLKNQMFTDFEVLLIDDGSKDNSSLICKKVASEDNRFRYYYQENQGVSAARNNGISLSKGKYITFIDSDDIIPENYLQQLYDALINNNADISFCDVSVSQKGKEINRFTLNKDNLNKNDVLNLILSRKNINSGPCAKLFKKAIIEDLIFPPLKAYEDILFVVDAVSRCEKFAATNKTEYIYLQNDGSAMNSFMKVPSADIITVTDKLLEFIVNNKILDSNCFYITASHLMQYIIPLSDIKSENANARIFINSAKSVYKKYLRNIISCDSFPWKEKVTYFTFTKGFLYVNGKFIKV